VRRQHWSFRSPLPFFHNGFAKDLWSVVDFYNTRFNIGHSKQEKSDLVAFLRSL
jgi:cytochrome c peroxidase